MARRDIPIVMDEGALSTASIAAADSHDHDHDEPRAPLPGPAPVLLRVGDTEIDEAEVAREMQHHRDSDPARARLAAARTLVVRTLVRKRCASLSIEAAPIDGETADEALARQLLDAEVQAPRADDASVQHYFDANRHRLHTPTRLRVRHILLAAPPSDASARLRARRLGETLIAELRDCPGRFAEFATQHSACPSREEGGELGWLEVGDTVPEFERQLAMLKDGVAGLTVETRYGHHVVEILARIEGTPLNESQARHRIAAYLETQAQQNAVHQYLKALAEAEGVEGLDLDA